MPGSKTARVSFGEAMVHEVPSAMDMTDDEVNEIWFTSDDYQRMKEEDKAILKKLTRNIATDECARGLENRNKSDAMYRRIVIMDAICAVMVEQDKQKKAGTNNPDRIRLLYHKATLEFTHEASVRGQQDAEALEQDADIIDMKAQLLSMPKKEELMVHKKTDAENVSTLPQKFLVRASSKVRRRRV